LTFERYLQEYEKRWDIDERRQLQLPDYEGRTLYTTWALSYTHLQRHNPNAAKLLELLAFFDNQSIWYELLHGGLTDDAPEWLHEIVADDVRFDSIMTTLAEYCFIEVQTALNTWSMHACVHDWTRASLKTATDTQKYWYAFDCILASINEDDWDYFGHLSYGHLAAHAARLVQYGFRQDDLTYDRLGNAFDIAELLRQQAQLTAAEEMLLLALARSEEMLGFEDELTLDFVNNLGNVYLDLNKLATAEQMLVRALVGKENALGPEHTSTLATAGNLGIVYRIQGRLVEAEQMHSRALAGYEKAWGAKNTHHSTLDSASNLGNLYRHQGRLGEAEQMLLRALDGYEMAFVL
jgi:tetratricopeptide (TPR) repeat protein